jgi:competence protein ComEA
MLIFAIPSSGCRRPVVVAPQPAATVVVKATAPLLNLNRATETELEALPGLGPELAKRIVAHRRAYGPLRRVEHLLLVKGFSEKRWREIRDLVTVD